jgi:Fic family protein
MVYGFDMEFERLSRKKAELDRHRPLPDALLRNLDDWFRVELTYTSNAIEGNTLSRAETALVVEKGLTVGGKTLAEHLEATNHAHALDWVRQRVSESGLELTQKDILTLHEIILKGIDDSNAGFYRGVPVRISGSRTVLPAPRKVPDLMDEFESWLASDSGKLHPAEFAAEAHYRLVTIHPFIDGNGRTARLLMNLILMRAGYPPAIIRLRERLKYLTSLEAAQTGGAKDDYLRLIGKAVERSLDIYLKAAKGESSGDDTEDATRLLKIGELAKETDTVNSTLRHWLKEGLIEVAETTPAGYQLFSSGMVMRVRRIRELQAKRLTIAEIKRELEGEGT